MDGFDSLLLVATALFVTWHRAVEQITRKQQKLDDQENNMFVCVCVFKKTPWFMIPGQLTQHRMQCQNYIG